MDLQPTLVGETILLRPLREADFKALFAAASDPLIWEQHTHSDRWKPEPFRKFFDSGLASGGAFLILDRSSGAVIGSSRYYDHRPAESRVTLGYTFLVRSHWGGEANRELKRLMIEHALRFVEAAYFEIAATNLRSRRAIEKLGAELVESLDLPAPGKAIYRFTRANTAQNRCDSATSM